MREILTKVGGLTTRYKSDEGLNSDYDLAMEFASDEDLAIYLINHEAAKEVRGSLSRIAGGLVLLQKMKLQGDSSGQSS